jgi:hypothetical protein
LLLLPYCVPLADALSLAQAAAVLVAVAVAVVSAQMLLGRCPTRTRPEFYTEFSRGRAFIKAIKTSS